MIFRRYVYAAPLVLLLTGGCSDRAVSYSRDINPILQNNCAVCHRPDAPGFAQSGFNVATYADVMKGTKYAAVITPGSSVGSTLVRLLKHEADNTINMPKNYTIDLTKHDNVILPGVDARDLPPQDVDAIATWIDQGAKNN